MKQNKGIGLLGLLFLVLCLVVAICYEKQGKPGIENYSEVENTEILEKYTASFWDVFNTKSDIIGFSTSEEKFKEQMALLKEKLDYYHKLYDIYEDYEGIANIKTINDNAGIAPVKVSREIIDLLLFSKEMYTQTNGQMNIAMGSVLKIWHNYREEGFDYPEKAKLPPMEELQQASAYCDIDAIEINVEESTVYIPDKNMSIDVGSIGKGYAVERVAEYAVELGMESLLLSIGGNICAVGTKPDGSSWTLGVQNPDLSSEEAHVCKVKVEDVSVVSSGNYQRYYMVDGKRYCHIIDGDTLMPADYFAAVTIICEDSGRADALSTAVFNMPVEDGQAFVNSLDGVEAIWVLHDGTLLYSDNFSEYVVK